VYDDGKAHPFGMAWGGKSSGTNKQLEQLGPLKDLALGFGWFVAIQ
jgi:hypothetical protein